MINIDMGMDLLDLLYPLARLVGGGHHGKLVPMPPNGELVIVHKSPDGSKIVWVYHYDTLANNMRLVSEITVF